MGWLVEEDVSVTCGFGRYLEDLVMRINESQPSEWSSNATIQSTRS